MPTKTRKIRRKEVYGESWRDDIYTTDYWILVADSVEGLIPVWKKLSGSVSNNPPDATDAAFTDDVVMKDGTFNVFICLPADSTPGTVAHECNHAVNMTFKYHGTILDSTNDEHQSYYLGALVDKCTDIIAKYKATRT